MSQYGRITQFLILFGFLALLFAGLSAPLTYAQTPAQPDTKVTLDIVDHRGGSSQSIFATEAHIYVNFGFQFAILERIDDTTFRRVGFTLLADWINEIHVDGQYAYIAGETGLHVIDVSDPANPTVVAEIASYANSDMVVSNGYAYLVRDDILDIIDVSQPAQPTLVCTRCGAEHGVDVKGDRLALQDSLLYIGSYSALNIYDVSDPTTPSLLGTYQSENTLVDLSVQGQFAYVTTRNSERDSHGLDIVSIANPQAPALVKHLEPKSDAWWPDFPRFNLVVDGQYAYVVLPGNRLWIVDISTPTDPRTASLTTLPVTNDHIVPSAITKVGSNLYLALQSAGFMVLDVTDPSAPNHIITSASHSQPVGRFVHLKAPYLYGGGGIFDISNPASPQSAGQYHGEIRLMQGQYGFGRNHEGDFAIFDLSRPLTPTITGTYPITNFGGGLAVGNNHAYVADHGECIRGGYCPDADLDILDISDPAQPRWVGRADIVPPPRHLVARGSYLYTSQDGNFHIYDISDPVAPRKVGSYTPPEPGRVKHFSIRGHFVFLATEEGGLQVIDIRDPANPIVAGSHPSHAVKVLHVTDTYAYVTSGERYGYDEDVLNVIDITDITDLETAGRYLHPFSLAPVVTSNIEDIVVVGEYAYLIGNGLFTLHQQEIELPLRTYLPVSSVADR